MDLDLDLDLTNRGTKTTDRYEQGMNNYTRREFSYRKPLSDMKCSSCIKMPCVTINACLF